MSSPSAAGQAGSECQAKESSVSNAQEEILIRAWKLADDGKPDAAWELIEPLVAASVPHSNLGLLYARLSRRVGRDSEALAFAEWLLQTLTMPPDRVAALHFAAFAILDHQGAYDKAFEHARLGKQAYRFPFDRRAYCDWTDTQIAYFTAEKLNHLPRPTHGNRRPVFIIGMPRSGTSLVEQILACHPQVHAAGELMAMNQVRAAIPEKAAIADRYPACLDSMGIRQTDQLAAIYLRAIDALNSTSRYVTDKKPTNYEYLGLIATLFRGCHIIHCKRNLLDTCLSCFTTGLPGFPFTNDLTDLATFCREYRKVMDHWHSAVRWPMIEVQYERLIEDLEGETRRLLQLLDLPWEERCLEFHRNERNVGTASLDQVRRPIYTSSIGRWKHYEKHLDEVISILGPDARES
jgi:hypothetical protein